MLKLQISRSAEKFFDDLPPKQFRQIMKKVFSLLNNPYPTDAAKLKGYSFMRNDVGEYRIIYDIVEDVLRLILVGKRNDDEIYKLLNRILSQ